MTKSIEAPELAARGEAAAEVSAADRENGAAFEGFSGEDFDVFAIPGLAPRMAGIIERVRPKLHTLGSRLSPYLSALCGEEIHPHVARHARRTINPPVDTWVAFAASKRGYKALPHFQIGLFGTHLFIQFAVIYESPNKTVFAKRALPKLRTIRKQIPADYVWSGDHTVPDATPHGKLKAAGLEALFRRLDTVKASEILCGIHIDRDDPLLRDGEALIARAEETFRTLLPLYRLAFR